MGNEFQTSAHQISSVSHQIKSNQKLQQTLKSWWSNFSVAEGEKYIEQLSKIQVATWLNRRINLDKIQDKETIGLGSDNFFY